MANKIEILVVAKDLASKAIGTTKKGLDSFGASAKKVSDIISKYAKIALVGLAGSFAAAGFAAVKASGEFEQHRIAFETMLGSAEKADKLLKDITRFAATTPFELPGLIEASKKLLAFGISAGDIIPTMRSLGDIAAGIGMDKLPTLTAAFGKIKTKGKATMEELNMLLEAGVPILDELAAGFGVSTEQLFKMISNGKVGFADVEAAIKRLTTGSGRFAGLMDKQSRSFFGIISNIKDNLTQTAILLGNEMLPELKKFGDILKNITTPENITNWVKNFKVGLSTVALGFRLLSNSIQAVMGVFSDLGYKSEEVFEKIKFKAKNVANKVLSFFKKSNEKQEEGQKELNEKLKEIDDKRKKDSEKWFGGITKAWNDYMQNVKSLNKTKNTEIAQDDEETQGKITTITNSNLQSLLSTYDLYFAELNSKRDVEEQEQIDYLQRLLDTETLSVNDRQKLELKIFELKAELRKKNADLEEKDKNERKRSEEQFWNDLAQLANSKNKEMAAIGKAAAIRNISVKTYEAAMNSYNALAGIPIVGPALGFAAAAAAVAYGAEQAAGVAGVQMFAKGGIVDGNSTTGDNVPIRVNSGEMVLNNAQQKNLFDLLSGKNSGGNGKTQINIYMDTMKVAEAFIPAYNKGRDLNLVGKLRGN